ncbi:MAG: hypothetical protein AAGE01_04250 [Pseudomonadota bacterium]
MGPKQRIMAALLALLTGAAAAAELPSRETWASRSDREAVRGEVDALLGLARHGDRDALQARIEGHQHQAPEQPAWHEAVLAGFARALAKEAPDPTLVPLLEALTRHEPVALAGHPERRSSGIPAFRVAGLARGTLNRWTAEAFREEAAAALAVGNTDWFAARSKRPATTPEVAGLDAALAAASAETIVRVGDALAGLWQARPELARTATSAALAAGSAWPVTAALAGPGGARLVPDLPLLHDRLPAAEAAALREAALEAPAPEVRSTAVGLLAQAGELERTAALLGDPALGSSAALALANTGAFGTLEALLANAGSPKAARRDAVLALRIDGSPRARAILDAAAAGEGPGSQEVRQWLD